jgi:hypothetical protein
MVVSPGSGRLPVLIAYRSPMEPRCRGIRQGGASRPDAAALFAQGRTGPSPMHALRTDAAGFKGFLAVYGNGVQIPILHILGQA